jgi:hypothetical protein
MKIINKISILLSASFVFFSCKKPLDIDIPKAKSQMAIFSQIIPNQLVAITVTRTFTALTDITSSTSSDGTLNGVLVSRAFVTLKHINQVDTLRKITDGLYGSANINLTIGENYELNVYDSTSGERIKSNAQVLPVVEDSLKITVDRSTADTTYLINCKIKDHPGVQEYYYINITNTGKIGMLNQVANFFSTINSDQKFILMSDKEALNGSVKIAYTSDVIRDSLASALNKDSITIVIASISKSYYDFLDAYKKGNSFFSQIIGEPINYPSNIENGVGVFTAHIPKFYYLDLENY